MNFYYKNFLFLCIVLNSIQSLLAMDDLRSRLQQLAEELSSIEVFLNDSSRKKIPEKSEKEGEKPAEQIEIPQESEKEEEKTECLAGIKIIEAGQREFYANEKAWDLSRIEHMLKLIEQHSHAECPYAEDITEFIKKLRQREDALDPCGQQEVLIKAFMQEFSEQGQTLSEARIKEMKGIVNDFLKKCSSKTDIEEFYNKLSSSAIVSKENKQQRYDALSEELYKVAPQYRKNPNDFSMQQLRDYAKKIMEYNTLYLDRDIVKEDKEEAKRYHTAINMFNNSITLSLGLSERGALKKEIASLLKKIESQKKEYIDAPEGYIDQQVLLYASNKLQEFNALVSKMRVKGGEGIDELQAAYKGQKETNEFMYKNTVIPLMLANIKQYKEDSQLATLEPNLNSFVERLLNDLYAQIDSQKQLLTSDYADIVQRNAKIYHKQLFVQLVKSYLKIVKQYVNYATFFGFKPNPGIDQIILSAEEKQAQALAEFINQLIKAPELTAVPENDEKNITIPELSQKTYNINEVIQLFEEYKGLQSKLGKQIAPEIDADMKLIFKKQEKNKLDTLNNEIIVLINPYKKDKTYTIESIETAKIDLIFEKIIAFAKAANEYANKTGDEAYAKESIERFVPLAKQIVQFVAKELETSLKQYQKKIKENEYTYDFSTITDSQKTVLFSLFDFYRKRLAEYRAFTHDSDFHKNVSKRFADIEQMMLKSK